MANANVGTRESIIKQIFNSFKDMFINAENENAEIPTVSSLTKNDLKGVSKSDLKELFMESPKRVVEIAKNQNSKIRNTTKKKTSFAAGSSVSQGLPEISKETSKRTDDGMERE